MNKAKTKLGIILTLSVIAVLISVIVLAQPNKVLVTNDNSGKTLFIPEHAVQVAENVFSLGTATDVDGKVVEGFMFIDERKGNAKPGTECGNGVCDAGENANKCPADCGGSDSDTTSSSCYSLFAKGAGWKTTEPYVTSNETSNEINLSLTETSLNTWDSEVSFNIFGTGSSGATDGADDVSPDGKNEVMNENLGATNTIAYTIVWGYFSGPPFARELVEWDAVFNTAYNFGNADLNLFVMDYQNVATHEFGHALGLGHPPDTCTEQTMYAYASYGETKKRTLEAGDLAGLNELY